MLRVQAKMRQKAKEGGNHIPSANPDPGHSDLSEIPLGSTSRNKAALVVPPPSSEEFCDVLTGELPLEGPSRRVSEMEYLAFLLWRAM
jgi:hypothetical protein